MRWNNTDPPGNSAGPPGNSADPPGEYEKEKENATERLAFSFFLFGDGSRRRPDRLFSFFRPGGLRTKIEFIGFAGTRTQTLPGPGPPFPLFPARWFAYENRIHWLCGLTCANLTGARAAFSLSSGTGFALGNRVHCLCGQACANRTGTRAAFSLSSDTGFALENRVHWLCGQACANQSASSLGFTKQQTCIGQQQLDYEPRRACN